ncbi:MAG: mismatch repair protein MutT [Deinococcus sp.]|nr:mismatch repair protein MutT [Deinococcus sp.]
MTEVKADPVDIRLPLGGLKFSVRVAILCVRNAQTPDACLLANTEENLGFWYLPGGALGTGETSESCAAREWAEETGTPPGGMQLVAVVENHFGPAEQRQHEIGFYYRMEAPAELSADSFPVLDNANVRCDWIPLSQLESRPVYPLVIDELLRVPAGEIRHRVIWED